MAIFIRLAISFIRAVLKNARTSMCQTVSTVGTTSRKSKENIGGCGRRNIDTFTFALIARHKKKKWLSELRYPICEYPKGDNNEDYTLGDYMKPIIVRSKE